MVYCATSRTFTTVYVTSYTVMGHFLVGYVLRQFLLIYYVSPIGLLFHFLFVYCAIVCMFTMWHFDRLQWYLDLVDCVTSCAFPMIIYCLFI